jgi:hypothetical protein
MSKIKAAPKSVEEIAIEQDHYRGVGSALRRTFAIPAGVPSASIESLIDQLDQLG